MSWRIVFTPAYIGDDPNNQIGADEVVPENANFKDILELAKKWNWHFPMKIFTPSLIDSRFVQFTTLLHSEFFMEEDDYWVYVKPVLKEKQ